MSVWATTIISFLILVVAFMQWRTANQKVILDLFVRRMEIYDQVNDAIVYYWSNSGNLVSFNTKTKLDAAYNKSRFIFGQEVSDHIAGIIKTINKLDPLQKQHSDVNTSEKTRVELAELILPLQDKFNNLPATFTDLCIPYIRIDQKSVGSPWEMIADWFTLRNRKRLSYSDQPHSRS